MAETTLAAQVTHNEERRILLGDSRRKWGDWRDADRAGRPDRGGVQALNSGPEDSARGSEASRLPEPVSHPLDAPRIDRESRSRSTSGLPRSLRGIDSKSCEIGRASCRER